MFFSLIVRVEKRVEKSVFFLNVFYKKIFIIFGLNKVFAKNYR